MLKCGGTLWDPQDHHPSWSGGHGNCQTLHGGTQVSWMVHSGHSSHSEAEAEAEDGSSADKLDRVRDWQVGQGLHLESREGGVHSHVPQQLTGASGD